MNLYRHAFGFLARVGRPIGGVRPRRITYWLHRKAFADSSPSPAQTQWWTDRWGSELLLDPYYFLDANIIAFGSYDPALHRYIENTVLPGAVCFDVGANAGFVSTHLGRKVGRSGQVHAFEPVPWIRERLVANINRNSLSDIVRAHRLALSNRAGTATMAASRVEAENQGQASLVNSENPALTQSIEVPTAALDEFVLQYDIKEIDLIKIDIQGAEMLLLEGGKRTFTELAPKILMEVSPEDMRGMGRTSRDLLQAVEDYGYEIRELDAKGRPGRRITPQSVAPDYSASNVLCLKNRPPARSTPGVDAV